MVVSETMENLGNQVLTTETKASLGTSSHNSYDFLGTLQSGLSSYNFVSALLRLKSPGGRRIQIVQAWITQSNLSQTGGMTQEYCHLQHSHRMAKTSILKEKWLSITKKKRRGQETKINGCLLYQPTEKQKPAGKEENDTSRVKMLAGVVCAEQSDVYVTDLAVEGHY